jgi:hypothetical protein
MFVIASFAAPPLLKPTQRALPRQKSKAAIADKFSLGNVVNTNTYLAASIVALKGRFCLRS